MQKLLGTSASLLVTSASEIFLDQLSLSLSAPRCTTSPPPLNAALGRIDGTTRAKKRTQQRQRERKGSRKGLKERRDKENRNNEKNIFVTRTAALLGARTLLGVPGPRYERSK